MSDAAGAGGRELGHTGVSDGDEFSRAVARAAAAQICEAAGFQGCQRSAIDTFADFVIRYVCGVGKAASFYANVAGRSECNVFDVIQGLEDLGVPQGFSSAADVQHCVVGSGVIKDIVQYAGGRDGEPFAHPIPRYPVGRDLKPPVTFAEVGGSPGTHIPDWLPVFPDPRTYVHTPVYSERVPDVRAAEIEKARQQRKAEKSLLSLHQRLGWSNPARLVQNDHVDNGKGKRVVSTNPFLASPLPYSESEVTRIVIPKENDNAVKRVSILEAFAPGIEAVSQGATEKLVTSNKRPTVRFSFGGNKRIVTKTLSSDTPDVRRDSLFLRDGEKDEKKRRAEIILKEAMENTEDLIHK